MRSLKSSQNTEGRSSPSAQRANVGMVEVGDRASLAFEALAMARVAGEGMTYDLDRYGAVEARVDRFPDHAHPSLADFLDQAVVLELLAGFESHGRVRHNVKSTRPLGVPNAGIYP